MTYRSRTLVALIGMIAALFPPGIAQGLSVQDLARLRGQGESDLWGLGFVTGLPGTGDPTSTLPAARALAKLLQNGGNPIPDIDELAKGKNIAMVMVTCKAPKEGVRRGDKLDVIVTSWHNAKSLEGGHLFLTPLQGPLPGQGVYASATGPLVFEGDSRTGGRVRGGATVTHDITMPVIARDGSITLVVETAYAGWNTAQLISSAINSERQGLEETAVELARAIDERTVRVLIPEAELPDPANFISKILAIRLDPSLLSLPAKVIVKLTEVAVGMLQQDEQRVVVAIERGDHTSRLPRRRWARAPNGRTGAAAPKAATPAPRGTGAATWLGG